VDKERILEILRAHEAELRASGLIHLRLFGSVARGESRPDSDVDLMAEFDQSKPLTLLTLSQHQYRLEDLLGAQVDLSQPEAMYPKIRARALAEAVLAF